jgi:hypothetical protein
MSDAFFVLLILFLYHLYIKEKIKLPFLTLLCCITILFSNPALFFIASVFIFEFIAAVKNKNKKCAVRITIAGLCVHVFFVIYYIFWLMPVAESSYMINFWEDHRFYLIPASKEHIINNILNIARIYRHLGLLFFLYPLFSLAGLIISLRQRNRISCVSILTACLLLIASQIGKYPMEPRIYMFAYVLIFLYSVVFIGRIAERFSDRRPVLSVIYFASALLVINNFDFTQYAIDRVYIETHEVNPLIAYVRENIRDGEYLYASWASYVLRFKNGYNTNRIGNVSYDNILYGNGDDLDRIVSAGKVYLLFQRKPPSAFLEELNSAGYLHKAGSYYQTPLYYFSTDPHDPKLLFTFEGRDFREAVTIIFRFSIKGFLEISVKSDDISDKVIININTFRNGEKVPHEYSIKRP